MITNSKLIFFIRRKSCLGVKKNLKLTKGITRDSSTCQNIKLAISFTAMEVYLFKIFQSLNCNPIEVLIFKTSVQFSTE